MCPDFTPEEIKAGRGLFAGNWQFVAAAGSIAGLPVIRGPEVAFAGRSNVGKSSLINALTGRKALARISHTPGRTQELIFFATAKLHLVDLPGHGYAAAPKNKIRAWTELCQAYLVGRASLMRTYLLVDARFGLKPVDEPVLKMLDEAGVSYQIVLTKCDQVKAAELTQCMTGLQLAMARRPAAFPCIAATSARTGAGIEALRAAIARLLTERSS